MILWWMIFQVNIWKMAFSWAAILKLLGKGFVTANRMTAKNDMLVWIEVNLFFSQYRITFVSRKFSNSICNIYVYMFLYIYICRYITFYSGHLGFYINEILNLRVIWLSLCSLNIEILKKKLLSTKTTQK